jgi:hypothetical protein
MIHKPRLRHLGRALAFAALFATGAARGAFGQAAVQTKPGEIILYMQPGTAVNDVNTLAATVNPASVTPLLLKDCYVLELPAARATVADTATAVATLKMNANVRWVNASRIAKPQQASAAPKITPNDPQFSQQWALPMINVPQAWVLTKGAANVNLGWIDTGIDSKHTDSIGQYLADSYNFADNNTNIEAGGSVNDPTEDGHGVGTSGVAFALTNNSIGISGIDWVGMKCLFCKVYTTGVAGGTEAAFINANAYLLQKATTDHIVAVNNSNGFTGADPGGSGGTEPFYVSTKALTDAGILYVASAGNSGASGNPPIGPADYPFVISVGAVDRNAKITAYSSFGKVDIAAPGGDNADTGVTADGIDLLDWENTYTFASGTSYAAPHVTAVLGLMMSVPGVTTAQAKQALLSTANRTGLGITTLPDPHYGFGLLDAYAALLKVSVSVIIDDPIGINAAGLSTDPSGIPPPPTETLKPVLRFKVSNVPLPNLSIKIDAGTAQEVDLTQAFLANQIESGNTSGTNPQYVVAFRYQFPNTAPFNHTITITGTNPNTSTTATDVRTFTIQSHTIPSGISLVSIPYYESAADSPTKKIRDVSDLLAPNVTLYRWLNLPNTTTSTTGGTTVVQGNYAAFGNGQTDTNASLHPSSFVPTPDTTAVQSDVTPLGLGYFINAPGPVTVATYGTSYDTTSFRIPLHEGWNMVGDPYKFSIPFDGLVFEETNGTRVTAEAAADQKLILPFIYRYVAGQYQFQTLPAGNLNAWEGQWIYVVPKNANSLRQDTVLTMITTPVAVSGVSGRAASKAVTGGTTRSVSLVTPTTPKVSGTGSWTVQLQASSKDLRDGYNFIGVTNSATKSANSLVPKPPHPSPYVTLGITDPAGNGTVYAQSLQTAGGAKTWNVIVNTDQPNTDITVRWPNVSTLPKTYRLTMQDTATGQVIDLRNQASYQFNSGHNAGTRAFTLTAHPTNSGGRAVLTNINVNPPRTAGGRAAGAYQIGYTVSQDAQVEVAVVGYNGQTVAVVGATRAVSSGDNSQVWNGKDTKGAVVPAGTYLLQVKAITSDGTVTREIRPLTITGR